MPSLKDDVLRTVARHKGSVTQEELMEAQLGNVIDVAVSVGCVGYVRLTSQGDEQQVSA